jgi:hypothetical protein
MAVLASALKVYGLLPRRIRDAVEHTAGVLVDQAIQGGSSAVIRRVRTSEEKKVLRHLARSIALTLSRWPDLDTVAVTRDFTAPPFSDLILRFLRDPDARIDARDAEEAFEQSRYDLSTLGIMGSDVLGSMQAEFASRLRADPDTRSVWMSAVIASAAASIESLRAKSDADRTIQQESSPLLEIDAFYSHWMSKNRLLTHAWEMVGRAELIDQLVHFGKGASGHQIALLPGRGGIGKSRLLLAVATQIAKEQPDLTIRIAAESHPISAADIAALNGPVLLIIDDAHRRDDLPVVLAAARRRKFPTRILVSTRPYGGDSVRASAATVGYDSNEILRLVELPSLTEEEATALARQALGDTYASHAAPLARLAIDSPLILVVAGKLLAEQSLAPGLLSKHEEFVDSVLGKLSDEYVNALTPHVGARDARSILEVIAAVAPFDVSSDPLVEVASELLTQKPEDFRRAIGQMVDAGILLRRGNLVKITPDVLADHLYFRAAVSGGLKTGFIDRVFESFYDLAPGQVLRNVAELDWQTNQSAVDIDLLSDIWSKIEADFKAGSNSDRQQILNLLERSAAYQPRRVLGLIEHASEYPDAADDDSEYLIYRSTHRDVMRAAASALRHIAFHPDYRTRALDLLWDIGRDDPAPINNTTNHAVRVLADLSSYETSRMDMARSIVEAAGEWAKTSRRAGEAYSVLDVVNPVLAKTGSRMETQGYNVVFHPYFVNPSATEQLRHRALEIVSLFVRQEDIIVRLS